MHLCLYFIFFITHIIALDMKPGCLAVSAAYGCVLETIKLMKIRWDQVRVGIREAYHYLMRGVAINKIY